MATNPDRLPPVNPETDRPIKEEPRELSKSNEETTTTTDTTTPPLPSLPETSQLNDQLTQLRNLSTALSAFFRRYDELHGHLNFIKTSIDSRLPDHVNKELALIPLLEARLPDPSVSETAIPVPEPNNEPNSEPEAKPNPEKSTLSELETLCDSMCGRSLRRYVVANLSDVVKLREEVPKALKFASNPAKLVLDCIGRFYVQGSKAYAKSEPLVAVRKASVLVLESFLLIECGDLEIDNAVAGEAAEAAVAWRKRIISEGGVPKAVEIDARGLLLLISCFGIPSEFKSDDIRDMLLRGNVRRISKALRRSSFLVPKIPEIIVLMAKNKLEVEGVDIAYTFGLEDKCSPQKILTTLLRHTIKSRRQGLSAEVKEVKKKQLADLKSVIKCLEAHKVDPAKLLPEWKINEKITSLQKEIDELDKRAEEKASTKRKADENESSKKSNTEDVKRARFTGQNVAPHLSASGHADGQSLYNRLPRANSFLDVATHLSAAGLADGQSLYNRSPQANSFLDGRAPANNINGYSASPSILHRSGQAENLAGSVAAGSIGLVHTNPYARVYRPGTTVNLAGPTANHSDGQPYGWLGDPIFNDRLASQAYAGRTYAPQRGDAALRESLVGQEMAGQPYALQPSSAGLIDLYRPLPSSLEGFAGLPKPYTSAGAWTRASGSDLYQFADSVADSESYRTSGNHVGGGSVPPVLPGRHSSYLR